VNPPQHQLRRSHPREPYSGSAIGRPLAAMMSA